MSFSLSVIVPVYNEEATIERGVKDIEAFVASVTADYEILIIESGSTDATGRLADGLAGERVRVVHEGARNGFGSALRLGYRNATKDLLWLVTVDLPFPLETFHAALPHLDHVDCVLSYRSSDPRSRYRRIQSAVYNAVIRGALGLPMRSVNSAFKVIRRDAILAIPEVQASGWFYDAELLVRLHRAGRTWVEIPVPLLDRTTGRSTVGPRAVVATLQELGRFLLTPQG